MRSGENSRRRGDISGTVWKFILLSGGQEKGTE
jgi:hypothetical protein